MKETYYLPVAKLKLRRHDNGAIFMHLDGQSVELAQLKRALPLSNPDEFIVLYDVDSTELGIIRHLAELDEGSRQVLQEALQKTYRIEQITRILEVERDTLTGQVRWRVEIDATPPSFESDAAPALPSTIPANEQAAPKTQASATPTTEADGETIAEPEQHRETNGVNGKAPHDEEKSPGKVKWFRHRDKDRETSEGDDTTISVEEREFLINGQEDIQTARYPHIYIVDTERNRYEILDCEALDIDSRQAAERYF